MDMDYKLYKSLKMSEEASKYIVSPHIYEELIEFCKKEIQAITTLENDMKSIKNEIKEYIKSVVEHHFHEEEMYKEEYEH